MKFFAFLVCVLIVSSSSKPIYDYLKSYITPLNKMNFENQINKIRQTTNQVTLVQFFKFNDGQSRNFVKEFNAFTDEFRGVFRILACDCDDQAQLCEKEKVTKFPTFRVYPPMPIPPQDYEDSLDIKKIQNFAARHLHSNIIFISQPNLSPFLSENPSVPKILLFTDKAGTPMIYKGLSVAFEKKLSFGLVRHNETQVVERYKIKTFPTVLVVKSNEPKPIVYKGEMKFTPLFEFLNVYSEAFVPGGGSSADSLATKQWLTESVPEMHLKSSNDICLNVNNALCVIIVSKGKPPKEVTDSLKQIIDQYEKKIDRGVEFKYMWLDSLVETSWADVFKVTNQPAVVILNPGKRKRFLVHEGELTSSAIRMTLEKVLGGDAKFVPIKDKFPSFASRKDI